MIDFETWWEEIEDRFLYGREAAEEAWHAAQKAEAKKSEMLVQCLLAIKGISNDNAAVALAEHALKEWRENELDT